MSKKPSDSLKYLEPYTTAWESKQVTMRLLNEQAEELASLKQWKEDAMKAMRVMWKHIPFEAKYHPEDVRLDNSPTTYRMNDNSAWLEQFLSSQEAK